MNSRKVTKSLSHSRDGEPFAKFVLLACFALIVCRAASATPPGDACTQYWTCVQSQLDLQRNEALAACTKAAAQHAVGGIAGCESRIQPNQGSALQACSAKGLSCKPVQITLDYKVATLMYAAPGNSSSVTYGAGSSTGSSQGFSLSQGYSVANSSTSNSSVGLGNSYLSAGYSITSGTSLGGGTTNATQYQVQIQKSSATTIGLQSKADGIDHGRDEFQIWFHPKMVITQTGITTFSFQILPPAASDIFGLSVNELLGKESVPLDKIAQFKMLTPQDIQSILALDPFVNPNPALDPNRYVALTDQKSLQLIGPDHAGDNGTPYGETVSDSSTQSTGHTETFNSTSGVSDSSGANAGINLGPLSFKVNNTGTGGGTSATQQTWSWSIGNSSQTSTGTTQSAALTLNTSTVAYKDLIDIYEDTLFHTFLFVSETNGNGIPPNEPPTLTGIVMRAGVPVAKQMIQIRLANGTVRKVFTDSKGKYSVYRAAGATQILVGNQAINQVLAMGKSINQNIQLP